MKIMFKDVRDNQLVLMDIDFVCYLDSLFADCDFIPKNYSLKTSGLLFSINFGDEGISEVYLPNIESYEGERLIKELFEKDKLDLTSYFPILFNPEEEDEY